VSSPWLYGIAYTIPGSLAVALLLHGPWVFFPLVYVFVVTPALDAMIGRDLRNPAAEEEEQRRADWRFDLWTYVWLPMQLGLLYWVLVATTSGDLRWWEVLGLVASMGVVSGGGGITVAHELMHRSRRFEKAFAELLMTSVAYPHFCVEHVFGHHRWVGTERDPATARSGQTLYQFLPQTIVGSARSFWRIETERVRRSGRRGLADARIRYPVLLWCFLAAVGYAFGPAGLLVFLAQSAVAVLLLEAINYVEHYGLRRRLVGEERWERVEARHSWNSDHWLTGLYLFNLPRHADHHYLASRPYPVLRHLEDSPQLPAGYSTMVLVAAVPPLWHRVMDPKVQAWNERHDDGGLAAPS
jgi:alkane 1-monooxygenase